MTAIELDSAMAWRIEAVIPALVICFRETWALRKPGQGTYGCFDLPLKFSFSSAVGFES